MIGCPLGAGLAEARFNFIKKRVSELFYVLNI